MKNELYFIELRDNRFIDYEEYLLLVSSEKRDIIQKIKYDIDKKLSLLSDLFVRHLACTMLSLNNNDLIFDKTAYGKPYLVGYPTYQYNVSHTQNAIVIGISEKPIGVDIEKIKSTDLKIAERFFCKNELEYILSGKEEQKKLFYEIWTKKEAYIKWVGKGIINAFKLLY